MQLLRRGRGRNSRRGNRSYDMVGASSFLENRGLVSVKGVSTYCAKDFKVVVNGVYGSVVVCATSSIRVTKDAIYGFFNLNRERKVNNRIRML